MGKRMGYRTRGEHQEGKTGSRKKGVVVEGEGSAGKWTDGQKNGKREGSEVLVVIRGKKGRRGVV